MSESNWYEKALEKHSKYMEEQFNREFKKATGETNYLSIFFGVAVIVGIFCTILYFTKWKKESYQDEENKKGYK